MYFFAMCTDRWMGRYVDLEPVEGLHVHAALWTTHTVNQKKHTVHKVVSVVCNRTEKPLTVSNPNALCFNVKSIHS